jgi:hypothetical protein
LKLRAEGKNLGEVAAVLGITSSAILHLCREGKSKYFPVSSEQRESYRAEWMSILEKISPGPPKLATGGYPSLYGRLLSEDKEWFQETMKAYRQRYNHSRKRINWPARDEEYAEAIVAAAARLQRMERTEILTVRAVAKEAGIDSRLLSKFPQHLPKTVAILTRLTEKPWGVFLPYLDGGTANEG